MHIGRNNKPSKTENIFSPPGFFDQPSIQNNTNLPLRIEMATISVDAPINDVLPHTVPEVGESISGTISEKQMEKKKQKKKFSTSNLLKT